MTLNDGNGKRSSIARYRRTSLVRTLLPQGPPHCCQKLANFLRRSVTRKTVKFSYFMYLH